VVVERAGMVEPAIQFEPGEVTLQEGEEHWFNCSAGRLESAGVPRAAWRVGAGQELPGHQTVGRLPEVGGVSAWALSTALLYRASAGDISLQCTVTAVDDLGVAVQWSREWSGLTVIPSVTLAGGFHTWQLALLILLPLLAILLLLLLLCCCYRWGWRCPPARPKPAPSPPPRAAALQMVAPPPHPPRRVRPAPYIEPPPQPPAPRLTLPWDPYADQKDAPLAYRLEGGGSAAGSLSSIATSGQEEDTDPGQAFATLGPRFAALAQLYGE
jgi:hypothetical protein